MKDKDPEEIEQYRARLANQGIEELKTRSAVEEFLSRSGVGMIVVNSVCGCAGEAIREGVVEALQELDIDQVGTVFAGEDEEATEEVRRRASEEKPSSPAVYLYQDGVKQAYIPRKFTLKHEYDPQKVTQKLLDEVARLPSTETVAS